MTTTCAQTLDPHVHAAWARLNHTLSPESVRLAWLDWAGHLALSPGKQQDLAWLAWQESGEWLASMWMPLDRDGTPGSDRRFAAPEWQHWPFHVWRKAFLLRQWQDVSSPGRYTRNRS